MGCLLLLLSLLAGASFFVALFACLVRRLCFAGAQLERGGYRFAAVHAFVEFALAKGLATLCATGRGFDCRAAIAAKLITFPQRAAATEAVFVVSIHEYILALERRLCQFSEVQAASAEKWAGPHETAGTGT